MNKKLLVAIAAAAVVVSSSSFAAVAKQGFYVGAQGGFSRANDGNALKDRTESFSSYDWKQGGFGWRALAGFQINRNFAVEAGYTRFADNSYRTPIYDLTHKTGAWDLVGKGILPLGDSNFDLYAKAGAAYQQTKYSGATIFGSGEEKSEKFRPVAGIGAAYNFDNGLAVDVSWTRVFGSGKTDRNNFAQPDSDLAAVGLTYTFQQWA